MGLISGPPSLACTSAFQPCCSSTDSMEEGERMNGAFGPQGGALHSLTAGSIWAAVEPRACWPLTGHRSCSCWEKVGKTPGTDGHSPDPPFLRAAACRRMCEGLYRVKMLCTPTFTSILLGRRRQANLKLLMSLFNISRLSCLTLPWKELPQGSRCTSLHTPATSQIRDPHCTQVNLGAVRACLSCRKKTTNA